MTGDDARGGRHCDPHCDEPHVPRQHQNVYALLHSYSFIYLATRRCLLFYLQPYLIAFIATGGTKAGLVVSAF